MAVVNARDLRHHVGDVLALVEAGESITIVRAGRPVAELVPLHAVGSIQRPCTNGGGTCPTSIPSPSAPTTPPVSSPRAYDATGVDRDMCC